MKKNTSACVLNGTIIYTHSKLYWITIFGIVFSLVWSGLTKAAVKIDDEGKLSLFGDVRFRAEHDDRTDPPNKNQERDHLCTCLLALRCRTDFRCSAYTNDLGCINSPRGA